MSSGQSDIIEQMEPDPVEIECMLSILVNGEEQLYSHTYKLTPVDLRRDAPERFSQLQVSSDAERPALHIVARAKFRRIR